jgi:hypothetical protein
MIDIKTEDVRLKHTLKWVEEMVVGMNLCPFAKRVLIHNSMRLVLDEGNNEEASLECFLKECRLLDATPGISTTLIVLPELKDFRTYLHFADLCTLLVEQAGYEGIYQVATFHPDYCFGGVAEEDTSNYTNRSPYPVIHILREEELSDALQFYPNPEEIPERNIALMESKTKKELEDLLASFRLL